jgi:type I restriction enzyme S subunit
MVAVMSKWKECKLKDVAENFAMGPFGSNIKAENFKKSGVPVIRGTNLNYHRYVDGEFVFLTEEKADELKTSNCFSGDLVFTHRGTIGQVGIIPCGKYPRYVVSQSGMKVTPNSKLLDGMFLFYFFKSDAGQHELLQHESQVAVPSISSPLTSLKAVNLLLPPLPEQKAIASVLSSLDDKIDLLHRQNKTLEAMAEALFRQWFVEDADETWEEKPLSSIADFLNGLACQKYPPQNDVEKLPVLKIRELSNGVSDSSDWATTNISKDYIIETGDVIFAWSASLMIKIWDGEKAILNQHLFKVSSKEFPKWFYFMWCKHHLNKFIAISETHATTMGHIKRGDLDDAIVLIPSDKELKTMNNIIEPIIEKVIDNYHQLKTLIKLRDTLLPKLMSSEVRIAI